MGTKTKRVMLKCRTKGILTDLEVDPNTLTDKVKSLEPVESVKWHRRRIIVYINGGSANMLHVLKELKSIG